MFDNDIHYATGKMCGVELYFSPHTCYQFWTSSLCGLLCLIYSSQRHTISMILIDSVEPKFLPTEKGLSSTRMECVRKSPQKSKVKTSNWQNRKKIWKTTMKNKSKKNIERKKGVKKQNEHFFFLCS